MYIWNVSCVDVHHLHVSSDDSCQGLRCIYQNLSHVTSSLRSSISWQHQSVLSHVVAYLQEQKMTCSTVVLYLFLIQYWLGLHLIHFLTKSFLNLAFGRPSLLLARTDRSWCSIAPLHLQIPYLPFLFLLCPDYASPNPQKLSRRRKRRRILGQSYIVVWGSMTCHTCLRLSCVLFYIFIVGAVCPSWGVSTHMHTQANWLQTGSGCNQSLRSPGHDSVQLSYCCL